MALRYLLFIIVIFFISFTVSFYVKAPSFDSLVLDISHDPLAKIKRSYAKMIWKGAEKEKDYALRFNMLKRVLEYDSGINEVYSELCNSRAEFLKADIELKDYLNLIREGLQKTADDKLTDCYLNTLLELSRYDEAIDFLKHENIQSADEGRAKAYLEKLKSLQNEKNILDITKAVEKYYQKTKSYPGDILVLINEGLLKFIPDEPYGGQYFISRQGQVKSTSEVEGK